MIYERFDFENHYLFDVGNQNHAHHWWNFKGIRDVSYCYRQIQMMTNFNQR